MAKPTQAQEPENKDKDKEEELDNESRREQVADKPSNRKSKKK